MKRTEIRVSYIEIRLQNGDLSKAQDLRSTIGRELLREIAGGTTSVQISGQVSGRSMKIARIDAGRLSLKNSAGAETGSAIARQVATAMRAKLTPPGGRER
jgi:hypothetical protein